MALVAWYKLDGNALDSHKNDLHGDPANMTYENGLIGQAGRFNGTNGYIRINDVPQHLVGRSYSISAWIKTDGAVTGDEIVAINNATGSVNRALWRIVTGGVIDMFINDGFKGAGNVVVNDSMWHHVCYTFDYNTSEIRTYVDGSPDNAYTSLTLVIDATDYMHIGMETDDPDTPSDFFDGWINDVRIYDHILSAKEIKELSMAKVLHYEFNLNRSAASDVVSDSSGYGFDATLNSVSPPQWSSDTIVNYGCYVFDGVNETTMRVSAADFPVIFTSALSVSFWVLNSDTSKNAIICHGNANFETANSYYVFYSGSTDKLRWSIDSYSLNDYDFDMIQDQWYHTVFTYDGTDANIYIDGVFVHSTQPGAGDINNVEGLTIGNFGSNFNAGTLDGKIADFRLYNKVLSMRDIKDLYESRVSVDNKGNLWC
jgi:hypothetical protein